MCIWRKVRLSGNVQILLILVLGLCLSALAAPVNATNVTVGCTGGNGTYPSVNAALAVIGSTGPSTITVTGTCNENVTLTDARSITIMAPLGGGAGSGGATIIGPPDSDAFDFFDSQDIKLQNLEIRGNAASSVGAGVVVAIESEVRIRGCNIHDNPDVGVAVTRAQVILQGDTIQNNTPGDGLDVGTGSNAEVSGTTIQNNGFGVFVFDRSGVGFTGQNSILNNGDGGIQAVDVSRVVIQTGDPALFTTIRGHNVAGIQVASQTMLRMFGGPHVIQGNGSACPTDPTCGGIFALRNSTLRLSSGNISGNQGSGIAVQQLADLGMDNMNVSNNTGDGVHIQRISIADFLTANTITGNGGASVSCDTTSLVVGDLSTFSKVACTQIERPLGPPRPGNPTKPNMKVGGPL